MFKHLHSFILNLDMSFVLKNLIAAIGRAAAVFMIVFLTSLSRTLEGAIFCIVAARFLGHGSAPKVQV